MLFKEEEEWREKLFLRLTEVLKVFRGRYGRGHCESQKAFKHCACPRPLPRLWQPHHTPSHPIHTFTHTRPHTHTPVTGSVCFTEPSLLRTWQHSCWFLFCFSSSPSPSLCALPSQPLPCSALPVTLSFSPIILFVSLLQCLYHSSTPFPGSLSPLGSFSLVPSPSISELLHLSVSLQVLGIFPIITYPDQNGGGEQGMGQLFSSSRAWQSGLTSQHWPCFELTQHAFRPFRRRGAGRSCLSSVPSALSSGQSVD